MQTFASLDITLVGTGTGSVSSGPTPDTGNIWDVTVTGMTSGDTVTLEIDASMVKDLAGNDNLASSFTGVGVTYTDITGPIATIDEKIGQADPTNTSPIYFTIVFNEAIAYPSTFQKADIIPSKGTISTLAPAAGDNTYEISITGMVTDDIVTVTIAAGVLEDEAGNLNGASVYLDNSVTYTGP